MDKFKILTFVFCILNITSTIETTKLNYPRVLLPIFDKISINFTLEVIEKGCFKWMSSRQDLILITPQYDDFESECSSKAVVTVLSRERRRNTAIVLAEDTATTEVLRCDVILDVIDQLRVLTTTRELYLEEAPETFELWAQDTQGNAFTTLEGVEFDWKITPVGQDVIVSNEWQAALRFLTFTESSYHEVPKSLEKFEALHMKGYMVLLEGINTGTAKVTVRIPYPEYSAVPINEVYINVLANIILDPSDVHILAGDTVKFRILQLKQGKLQEVSLNNQYFLQIEDTGVATISGSKATGKKLGRTFVVLRDRNVPSEGSYMADSNAPKSPVPRATLTVSDPKKLTVNLLPHYNWMTVEGEKHEIAVDVYANDNQKITLGPKYAVSSQLDESLFYVLKKSQNGSRIYGEAVKEGTSAVHAAFKDLTAKAELQIFKELLLAPSKVIVPFDPNAPKTQKLQFRATGGDGSYIWTSQHPSLLQISQTGLATTRIDSDLKLPSDTFDERSKAILTNHANVRVALARNIKISRTAEVYFLPPVKLEIVQYNFETALRDYVKIHLAVYTFVNNSYVPFTKCENLNFNIEFTNQIFQIDSMREELDVLAPSACHIIHLRSTSIGTTHLSVSYKFMDKLLKDEATLMVFEKLDILNPVENEIILPIGSSRNLLYANGPQKIFTLAAELTKHLQYDKDIASVSSIEFDSPKAITAFTVLCRKVGQTTLKFDVFNQMQAKNFQPYVSNYMTTIYCVKPRFLNLYATEKLRQSCPMEMKNSLMHLKDKEEKFEIEIEIQDAKNRKLMNISSLLIEWQFAQEGENYHKDIFYFRESDEEIVEGVRLPGKDVLISTIKEVTSNFKVKGIVTNYDAKVLAKHGITPESPAFGIKKAKSEKLTTPIIENEIKFMAVNSTMFPSEHISIFISKNRPHKVPIQQGSGHYDFQVSENGVISIDFDAKRRELIITPHRIGHVRIELTDLCLMTEPAHLSVSVVSIGSIKVEVPDRVERTKSIDAIVKLYDSNENLLLIDPYNLQIYELTEDIFNPNILNVKLGDQMDLQLGEIRYTVTGSSLGESKIVFNSGHGELLVSSIPVNIQVFPPLRLYPRNSTLVIGSSVQIYYLGGPQPDVNIVYSVHDQNLITMESALVIARKLGHTKITGKCFSQNPSNGKEVIISEDTVDIHVVPLLNIQIKTPLVRIKSGAVMPAFIWGLNDLSPMVLGTLENMRVIWSSNQPDVIDIYNVFSEAGIEYSDKDLISVRIKALNPGKAKVQATVILPSGQKLTASVEVVVFKMLELDSPKRIKMDSILIAPRSTIQLKANLDDVVYKPDSDAANGIVRVSSDGIVRSGDTLGRDLIIARTYEQTLPIGIEVKNVQYILASLQYPSIKLKQTEEKIPRGMNFVLKVSLHDNLGNEFSHNIEDVNGIKYDLSHKDIVDVQIGNNLTVAINLPRETSNMIAISLKDTTGVKHAEDYIKLSVLESGNIFPTKTIFSVGDIICFDSPLTVSSHWSSSDERIVSIDRNTGVGKVLGNRFKLGEKVVVTNGDKTGSFLKYDVEVRDADKIEFFKSYDIFSGTSYRGHLIVRNHLQVDKFANLIAKNISKCSNLIDKVPINFFTCHLTSKQQQLGALLLDHYKVMPYFDAELGTYACQIDLTTTFNDVLNIVKTNEVNFELEARLPNGLTDVITLKFVPGIRVTPEQMYVADIGQQDIIITGLDKVLQKIEVKPSDTSILELIPQAKVHGSLQYKVKQLNQLPTEEQLFIYVHSPLTQEDIEIPIVLGLNALQQKCSNQPFSNSSTFLIKIVSNVGLIISALIILAATIWVLIVCSPQRRSSYRTDINSEVFSTSAKNKSLNSSSPVASGGSIGGSSGSFSNRTSTGQLYPNLPSYYGESRSSGGSLSLSPGNESPVYGDTTLISPQKRINRRYI
ncbi:nuclear pore membrane glycoprotein 210 [Eupeodes corollae]|uniref:nuclear pore membrane glycoprotein 210 n=1 Tax=Eupeodes corollae TaxID=290404 RepID=UPI002492691C|nr:nuclear pore membrane glycoprotein 210 [Eupeodes corollae]